jgi:hypothetical protein
MAPSVADDGTGTHLISHEAWLIGSTVDASKKNFVATGILVFDVQLFIGRLYEFLRSPEISKSINPIAAELNRAVGCSSASSDLLNNLLDPSHQNDSQKAVSAGGFGGSPAGFELPSQLSN